MGDHPSIIARSKEGGKKERFRLWNMSSKELKIQKSVIFHDHSTHDFVEANSIYTHDRYS